MYLIFCQCLTRCRLFTRIRFESGADYGSPGEFGAVKWPHGAEDTVGRGLEYGERFSKHRGFLFRGFHQSKRYLQKYRNENMSRRIV